MDWKFRCEKFLTPPRSQDFIKFTLQSALGRQSGAIIIRMTFNVRASSIARHENRRKLSRSSIFHEHTTCLLFLCHILCAHNIQVAVMMETLCQLSLQYLCWRDGKKGVETSSTQNGNRVSISNFESSRKRWDFPFFRKLFCWDVFNSDMTNRCVIEVISLCHLHNAFVSAFMLQKRVWILFLRGWFALKAELAFTSLEIFLKNYFLNLKAGWKFYLFDFSKRLIHALYSKVIILQNKL